MPIFKYSAKNNFGETIQGKVESRNKSQAVSVLSSKGLLVVDIRPIGESNFSLPGMGKVKHSELVNFTRQLATMVNAGLPLAKALSILDEQSTGEMSTLVENLLKEIEGGSTFAKALEKHKGTFSRVYIQLVRAGEVGGMLDNVLERLAETMEKEKEFRSKTKGAMIYPLIVVIAMIVVAFVMMIFVIPQLTSMYKDFGAELPLPTKILMSLSDFFVKSWWLMLLLMGGGIAAFRAWVKTPAGEKSFDKMLMKIPIYGVLRKKIILTEFSRTLALLLSAGVPLLEALEIVGEAMSSFAYREAVSESSKQVEKGQPLSRAIGRYESFPPILQQMIAVGEETGKLNDVLFKLSAYFESESEQAVKNLTAAMEPMIMIVLGLGVGLMVVAVILPIYTLTSSF